MSTEPTAMTDPVQLETRATVAICAITFRRPLGLEKLLEGIASQRFVHTSPDVRVVIVENEADGPARAVCDRMAPQLPFPLQFRQEPRRGITFARNTAVETAGEVDFLAILDDDEIPGPNWLDELLRVQALYVADLVGGPVESEFESPPPEWIVRGGFHRHERFPTGSRRSPTGTHNVLIRRAALRLVGQPFDNRLALTGGEDVHLFRRMRKAGATSVWADEAVVTETVPPSRTTARWILARGYRIGMTQAMLARDVEANWTTVASVAWSAVCVAVVGLVSLPVNLFRGRHAMVRSVRRFARAAGLITGLFGGRYEEYRQVHGK
jgi:cellulose synthase/poly-beta-1,6-N-acetylglucosamine synthase-like glycosyltransferase